MPHLSHAARALVVVMAALPASCGPDKGPDGPYQEYECPEPVGKILQEDCAGLGLAYDDVLAKGSLSAGPVGASGEYRREATREASGMVQVLKDQRVNLCNSFNTCKMTVTEFKQEQRRIDDTFSMLLSITERLPNMSPEEAQRVLSEIRAIRNQHSGDQAAPVPVPAVAPPTDSAAVVHAGPPPDMASPGIDEVIGTWRPGSFMLQAVGRVVAAAHNIEQKTQLGFDRDHACVLGAFLDVNKILGMRQSFTAGKTYVIVGGGEDNARDVDLGIADENGTVLVSDTQDDAMPLVKFVPPADGMYEIKIGLSKSDASGSFVALAVLSDGGYVIPSDRLAEAFKNATAYGALIQQRLGMGLVFHGEGNWAFYGTVLEQGIRNSFSGVRISGQPAVVIAAGDRSSKNLDIDVQDEGGTAVVSDTSPDAVPVVQLTPRDGSYKVAVVNQESNGATLAALLILDRTQ